MAQIKITEKEVADALDKLAYILVTQPVTDETGVAVESLRRISVDTLRKSILADFPITTTEDGYTDISGLRRLKSWEIIEEGSKITLNYTLEGGATHTDVLNFDENGYPVSIVADGREIPGSWTVAEEAATDG